MFEHHKLIHVIENYEGEDNVVAISARKFLGRMYQLGFQEISKVEVACIMRVLGKVDLENAILLKDVEHLMEKYGEDKKFEHINRESEEEE